MKKSTHILLYFLIAILILLTGIGYAFYVPDIPVEKLNKKYKVTPANYIPVDRMKVHYRVEGRASDTIPLVLLHGTGSSLFTWNSWTHLLKDKHKVVRLDLPGFGLTGPHPQGDYTLKVYLDFIHSFLGKLNIEQCILIGNSLGGEIAWRYALNYPGKVKKLILIDAAGYPTEADYVPLSYILLRLPIIRDLIVKQTPYGVIRQSLEYLYADPGKVNSKLVELYSDMTCREGNRQALTERMESIAQPSPWKQLAAIHISTLILWGKQDHLIPVEYAHRFHKDLPNSTLIIFPDAGHMPMEEIPTKTALAAKAFIENATL